MWDKYGWPSSDARNAVSSSLEHLEQACICICDLCLHTTHCKCTTPAYNVGPTSHWMGLPTTLYIYIYLRTLYIWHRTLHIFVQPTRSSYNSLYHPCQHLRTSHSISLYHPAYSSQYIFQQPPFALVYDQLNYIQAFYAYKMLIKLLHTLVSIHQYIYKISGRLAAGEQIDGLSFH